MTVPISTLRSQGARKRPAYRKQIGGQHSMCLRCASGEHVWLQLAAVSWERELEGGCPWQGMAGHV